MGKSVRQTGHTDDELPVFSKNGSDSDTVEGLPVLKKKEAGSLSPSGSSPNTGKTGQSVSTSDLDPKRLVANYKNNSLTPNDVENKGKQSPIDFNAPSPEQISHSINNKGKNIDRWQNASSDSYIKSLVSQHQEVQGKIANMDSFKREQFERQLGSGEKYESDLKNLKDQETYLRTEIQKNYNAKKQKLVPELTENIRALVGGGKLTEVYDKSNTPQKDEFGMEVKSHLKWNPESHKLTPESVQWVAGHVDDIMNKKGDATVNAQVSGDLIPKKRTYEDLTRSVVDQLNMVPIQKAQDDFTKEYAEKNPEIKDAFNASQAVNEYFSKENVDSVKSRVNVDRDKAFIKTKEKYQGKGGVFQSNPDFIAIQHKYAQLVADGKMPQDVAIKNIQAEIKQNPTLKKINDNMDAEVRKINEKTQTEFQDYLISGLQKKNPKLTIYKDGSVGLAGLSQDQYTNMMEGYEEGLAKVANKMGAESEASAMNRSNEKAKGLGAFWGSVGSSVNEMSSAFSKFIFNKTQWGGDNVRYYEAQDIASPQASQSNVAASWNWKGLESLKDPDFWLSKTGSMVPVIAGAGAIGLATEGAGMPEYVGWLANAGLFTAQSGLSTYNQMLNTRDAQGNLLTEADASNYMADQMTKDFLPNVLMMAATSGTLLRAKNIVRPTIMGTVKKGILGAAEAQPLFTWTGYNDYATAQQAKGKKTDFWDYMQSKDFKDNLINGMVVGGGLSLLHAPGSYMKSLDHWTNMIHSSEGEFKNLIPQNYALGQEMAGNGNYLRDALKLHVFNVDSEGLNEAGKRQLADLKNQLLYSVNLDRNIRQGNLDPKSVKDLYQAHNLALADQHDYLSDQAGKEGNKSLSDIYKDKAKDYREQAKAASNGESKYHYLINSQGHPIFMSDKSFKTLDQEGTIAKWITDGTIEDIHSSDDPGFSHRYKEHVEAKNESQIEGKSLQEHGVELIEENKSKLKTYYAVAKENPELFYKEIADQVHGNTADGEKSIREDAEKSAREHYGNDIVDMAKMMYPKPEEKAEPSTEKAEEKMGHENTESGDYKKNIRDDYFAKSYFFTPEEKEKFATLDEAGQDKMIDDKRAELSGELPEKKEVISSPKIEKDGKAETKEAEGRQGDVLTPEKEGAGGKSSDAGAAPPLPPIPEVRIPEQSPKDEFTSIRKEKNKEIEGVKELFEKQKKIKWSETYRNALTNAHAMYPDKNWYDALKSRVGHFATLLDNKILFNPTSEDNAVFNMVKQETMRRMGQIQGWDSEDPIQIQSAQAEFTALQKDLYDVARVTNPGGEAGRAFNLLQSEISNDLENGLKIRRMELQRAKGSKLTDAELESSAKDFEKEHALVEKEHELKLQQQQEKFDKEIARLKSQVKTGSREPTVKQRREKLLSQTGKDFADKIRAGKLKGTYATFPGLPQAINVVLEGIAKLVEGGFTLAQAIGQFVKDNNVKDENKFKDDLFDVLGKQEKMGESYDKIEAMAKAGATGITNDMVSQNLIRDYINSHIGLHDQENILETAFKGLKELFPDLEKPKLIEAYLKENEFKQPTSKELKEGESQAKRQLQSIAKLEEDIADLSGYKAIRQRSFPTERERSEYEKKLVSEKEGIIKDRQDKKSQSEKEYRELESERNRQIKKVSELTDKKNKLDQGVREKQAKSKNVDTPEIEALKKQVKESDKNLRDAENEVKRIDREADAKTAKIAQYNYEIQRLKERGELQKRSKGKSDKEIDTDIEGKRKQLTDTMRSMGIKVSSEDKYTKSSYDQRAKSHNERIENLTKSIQDKLDKGNLSPETEKALIKLKGQIDASTIKLDPTSALSQEKTLDGGIATLKSIKSEFIRTADAAKVGDINRELQKALDKFDSDKGQSEQDIKLQRAKDKAKRDMDDYAYKIIHGEFEDHPIVQLTKTDAELIKLERDKSVLQQLFRNKKSEYEKKNKSGVRRFFDFLRATEVTALIGKPITLLRVAGSAFLRPNLEAATKLTFGKAFDAIPSNTTKVVSDIARAGGESSSIKSIKKGYEAYLRQYSEDQLKDIYTKANDKYEKSDSEYQKAKGELDNISDKDSKEYKDALSKMNDLKEKRNGDLVDALGNSVYHFIAGSSIKEGMEVLLHRSAELERQFVDFDREDFTGYNKGATKRENVATTIDNLNHVMNFIGRSHATLKNFSARFSFATGFVARLEYSVDHDIDVSSPDKLLQIAHESYHDWERGKYQEANPVTDTWNKITNAVERVSPEMAYLMRADVAITRVPVNMLREAVTEYTLGALTGSYMMGKEYLKARGITLQSSWGPDEQAQFKKELSENLSKMDPDKAAAIVRAYRKGGFGLGLYALALLGHAAFGGWAHKGQTAEDKKKAAREEETGVPEIKTSQIKIGDWAMPEAAAKILEHTPAFAGALFGMGAAQVYQNNIIDGKTTPAAATDAAMAQIEHITNSIPMIDKVAIPLAQGAVGGVKQTYFSGQWDDVDQEGNPMKRKAFEMSDYLNYLPGFSKKDILSENYYKQAAETQKSFRQQITDVETNTSLSQKDKDEQRADLLKDMNEAIDEIYKQNKENPQ